MSVPEYLGTETIAKHLTLDIEGAKFLLADVKPVISDWDQELRY